MKCKQVDDLLFSYCDRQEIPPLMLKELEEHLSQCQKCRGQADFTAREREALIYDGDVPEMAPDFTTRVLATVSQDCITPIPSWGMRIRSQIGSRGWWAMGMAATVVLSWLMLPGILKELDRPWDIGKISDSEAIEFGSSMIAEKTKDQQEELKPDLQLKMPVGIGYKNLDSQRIASGRGEKSSSLTPPSESSSATDQVAIFRPSYLPPNYHLARIESDINDNLSLYYENDQGGFICLKTLSDLEQDVSAMKEKSGGSSPLMNAQNMVAETPADPTVIRWTSQHESTLYRLELTGSLPPKELARVTASVK